MTEDEITEIRELLTEDYQNSIKLTDDLTDAEIIAAEEKYGFCFPPDLRSLLQHFLPNGPSFPDWRNGDEERLHEWLESPLLGLQFDIEHADFWLDEWGEKPESLADAFEVARREVAKAPKLIPVFMHRYLPDEPHVAGNPVLSVYGTDIIYYGRNLLDYFVNEFGWYKLNGDDKFYREVRF